MNLAEGIEKVAEVLAAEGGSFSLAARDDKPEDADDRWLAGIHWGREAEDSPMSAAAAYGLGSSASDAVQKMLEDVR